MNKLRVQSQHLFHKTSHNIISYNKAIERIPVRFPTQSRSTWDVIPARETRERKYNKRKRNKNEAEEKGRKALSPKRFVSSSLREPPRRGRALKFSRVRRFESYEEAIEPYRTSNVQKLSNRGRKRSSSLRRVAI